MEYPIQLGDLVVSGQWRRHGLSGGEAGGIVAEALEAPRDAAAEGEREDAGEQDRAGSPGHQQPAQSFPRPLELFAPRHTQTLFFSEEHRQLGAHLLHQVGPAHAFDVVLRRVLLPSLIRRTISVKRCVRSAVSSPMRRACVRWPGLSATSPISCVVVAEASPSDVR